MSSKLSLVTALLALIAIHSSESVDPEASRGAADGRSKSKPEEDPRRDALPAWMRPDYDYVKTISSWNVNEMGCSPNEELLVMKETFDERKRMNNEFKEQIFSTLMNRREICFARLEKEIQSELNEMSESTLKHFKLFAEQDLKECRSGSVCTIVVSTSTLIGKLRRLAGSPEDAAAAKRFVSACKEVAGHDRLATIRAKYEPATPSSPKPYFPYVRFYDFCTDMFDPDFSGSEITDIPRPPDRVVRFGGKLDEILADGQSEDLYTIWSEMAESDRQRSVAKAALQHAEMNSSFIRQMVDRKWLEKKLNGLKKECQALLSGKEDLIFMRQHVPELMGLGRVGPIQREIDQKNMRYLEACKQLGELENEEIIKAAGVGEEATALEK
jgi:hypothetical protein